MKNSQIFTKVINSAWICLDGFSKKRALAITLVGLLAFFASMMIGLHQGTPEPYVEDEVSFLLASDTFAHGRLTNPMHPMSNHFEMMFILQKPTYMSRFPPAQGAILAVGRVLFGHPIFGVWISVGLMCAAICWMLYGWVPPKWAVIGGVISILQFGLFSYWSQRYFGGAVAAFGGALVFGALRRMIGSLRIWDTLFLGLGFFILANSRPYECAVISIPVAGALLEWLLDKKRRPALRKLTAYFFLPLALVSFLTALEIGAYNKAVTGNAFQMPYILYEKTYMSVPIFTWQSSKPEPNYGYDGTEVANKFFQKTRLSSETHPIGILLNGLRQFSYFYFGFYFIYVLLLPFLLILPGILRDRWMRFVLLTVSLLIVFVSLGRMGLYMPHYFAPITCLAVLLILQSLRYLYILKFRIRLFGKILVFVILSGFLIYTFNYLPLRLYPYGPWLNSARYVSGRTIVEKTLKKIDGRHLIIVRYDPKYYFSQRWVYNEADIDNAPIVWAHELDEAQNRDLIEHFKDRHIWLVTVHNDGITYSGPVPYKPRS